MRLADEVKQARKIVQELRLKLSIAKTKLKKKGLIEECEILERIEEML